MDDHMDADDTYEWLSNRTHLPYQTQTQVIRNQDADSLDLAKRRDALIDQIEDLPGVRRDPSVAYTVTQSLKRFEDECRRQVKHETLRTMAVLYGVHKLRREFETAEADGRYFPESSDDNNEDTPDDTDNDNASEVRHPSTIFSEPRDTGADAFDDFVTSLDKPEDERRAARENAKLEENTIWAIEAAFQRGLAAGCPGDLALHSEEVQIKWRGMLQESYWKGVESGHEDALKSLKADEEEEAARKAEEERDRERDRDLEERLEAEEAARSIPTNWYERTDWFKRSSQDQGPSGDVKPMTAPGQPDDDDDAVTLSPLPSPPILQLPRIDRSRFPVPWDDIFKAAPGIRARDIPLPALNPNPWADSPPPTATKKPKLRRHSVGADMRLPATTTEFDDLDGEGEYGHKRPDAAASLFANAHAALRAASAVVPPPPAPRLYMTMWLLLLGGFVYTMYEHRQVQLERDLWMRANGQTRSFLLDYIRRQEDSWWWVDVLAAEGARSRHRAGWLEAIWGRMGLGEPTW